jgi:hypothetical protein
MPQIHSIAIQLRPQQTRQCSSKGSDARRRCHAQQESVGVLCHGIKGWEAKRVAQHVSRDCGRHMASGEERISGKPPKQGGVRKLYSYLRYQQGMAT